MKLEKLVLELAGKCQDKKSCSDCPLSLRNGICRLRVMSLTDVAQSLLRESALTTGAIWVKYSTRAEILEDLDYWNNLPEYCRGVDEYCLQVRLFAAESNELLPRRKMYGYAAFEAAVERFGLDAVRLIIDDCKDSGHEKTKVSAQVDI